MKRGEHESRTYGFRRAASSSKSSLLRSWEKIFFSWFEKCEQLACPPQPIPSHALLVANESKRDDDDDRMETSKKEHETQPAVACACCVLIGINNSCCFADGLWFLLRSAAAMDSAEKQHFPGCFRTLNSLLTFSKWNDAKRPQKHKDVQGQEDLGFSEVFFFFR